MASYQIISSAGADMGTYEGATAREAVEAMWADAGVEGSDALFAELTVRETVAGESDDGPPVDVRDYDTADALGTASAELVAESRAAGDTGAVPAYRDDDGVWQYVRPDDVESERRRGREVRTVYVEGE